MKIVRYPLATATIEAFAEQHGLVMEIRERPKPIGDHGRFYAHFAKSDISQGFGLLGVYGDGATEDEAIAAYTRRISTQLLVVDAFGRERREIMVPRLVPA